MPFDLRIPLTNGLTNVLSVPAGEIIFLLGANGTGKSSLMHGFYANYQADARWITAHRQTFFEGDGSINLSPDARRTTEQNMRGWDLMESARWSDIQAAVRPSIAIFDLVDAENIRAREIARSRISAEGTINVSIDMAAFIAEERARLQHALDARDVATIISNYPVRETQALGQISQRLGFQNRGQYESALRKLLMDDNEALDFVRSLFGALAADLASPEEARITDATVQVSSPRTTP